MENYSDASFYKKVNKNVLLLYLSHSFPKTPYMTIF